MQTLLLLHGKEREASAPADIQGRSKTILRRQLRPQQLAVEWRRGPACAFTALPHTCPDPLETASDNPNSPKPEAHLAGPPAPAEQGPCRRLQELSRRESHESTQHHAASKSLRPQHSVLTKASLPLLNWSTSFYWREKKKQKTKNCSLSSFPFCFGGQGAQHQHQC